MTVQAQLTRRQMIAGGVMLAIATLLGVDPFQWRREDVPVRNPRFPAWVYASARSGDAYEAAFEHSDLVATLPCFCGCGRFETPHTSLADCYAQPGGTIEPHAAFCETCQDETLDAVRWLDEGVTPDEIRGRIVAEYADRGPSTDRTTGTEVPGLE